MMKYDIEYRLRLKVRNSLWLPNRIHGIDYCIRAVHRPSGHRAISTGYVSINPKDLFNINTVLATLNKAVKKEVESILNAKKTSILP